MRALSDRNRVGLGLALGSLLGIGLALLLLGNATRQLAAHRFEREAIVTLSALTDAVERAGGGGDGARAIVAGFAAAHPGLGQIRVVSLQGVLLEASNAPGDIGERAAPRRLDLDEKPLYDMGQGIRAAIETNRQEGASRKEEISVTPGPGGRLVLGGPILRDGQMTGAIEMQSTVPAPAAASPLAPALLFLVAPLALFAIAARFLRRRAALVIAGAVLLLAGLLVHGAREARELGEAARGSERAIAASVGVEAGRTAAVLEGAGLTLTPPLDPAGWDRDVFRHPVKPAATGAQAEEALRRVGYGLAALALALFLYVALGAAGRTVATLIRYRTGYAYATPALLGMLLLVFFPFLYGITLSFTDSNLYNSSEPLSRIWIGLANFRHILGDFSVVSHTATGLVFNYQNFYWTLGFNVVWTVCNVAIGVSVGLALALILNRRGFALRPIYRVLLVMPWATPNYITALIWRGMFHQQFGSINQFIQLLGGRPVSWFEHPGTSFVTVLATNSWLSFPFMMVISLGALQSIPSDLYEAARVDGANRWQQFRAITLPSLRPALIPAVILSVIWTFNMFNIIYLVSGGDPSHSTELLITQAYKYAFEQYRYGYAAAYSTVIFLILLIYGVWQIRVTRATEKL
jgi:arabinogalactan oligomer / maltooligosaccharide transport system permease protein